MPKPTEEWQAFSDFISCFVATGWVKGEDAESLLIVGGPGVGKSTQLDRFVELPTVRVVSNITSDPLRKLVPDAVRRGCYHLLIDEFGRPLSRSRHVADAIVSAFADMMAGKYGSDYSGPDASKHLDSGQRFQMGILASLTTEMHSKLCKEYALTGLLDRVMCLDFSWSKKTRTYIRQNILSNSSRGAEPIEIDAPDSQKFPDGVAVYFPSGSTTLLNRLMGELYKGADEGLRNRSTRRVRALLRAYTWLLGYDEVYPELFDKFSEDFLRFFKAERI